MKRTGILRTAELLVSGQRDKQYGTPYKNFTMVANLWTEAFGHTFNAEDVAVAMMLLKIARLRHDYTNEDNWIDIAGYAACGGEIGT